jgi:hypothetical protein
MNDQTKRPATTYAVVVSDPGYFTGLDCIQHLTPDLDEARAVAACDLGDCVDIYRIFPDHYEWVETYVENRLISGVWRQAMTTLTNADLAAIRERRERTKNMATIGHRDLMENVSHIPALLDTIENLRAENARYRETLEYYANQQNWTDQGVCGRLDDDPDCGARAEFALAQRGKWLRGMG